MMSHCIAQGKTKEDVQSLFEPIVTTISSTITELIKLGAVTFVVPGNVPIGCVTAIVSLFRSSANKIDYDPSTGCITWLNDLAEMYNNRLQIELRRLQDLHPHANIIYADFYSAAMPMYNSPGKYGFTETLTICCGGSGPYHYNSAVDCGTSSSTSCADPSLYVNWDGVHMTEAAYRFIAQELLEGPFSVPQINSLCSSSKSSAGISYS
ncbi:hypothetical protein Leryth_011016 [Lithospermum erythrorhizon]|nr:hypothetical protein Leryth_011016 [Lithospermum erythrorhizon]